ncbi:MAG: 4Fe-4S dicluster domain-containing protein [Candidatus Woesearchaeota archaeon]
MLFTITRINLFNFLEELAKKMPVYAPAQGRNIVLFKRMENPREIELKQKPYYPIKDFFHKPKETLYEFDHSEITALKLPSAQRAFFGVRRCDLTALAHQKLVFYGNDPIFTAEVDRSLLLGYHCFSPPDEFCFCGNFAMKDNFDLMFYDEDEFLVVETGSPRGENIAISFQKYFRPRPGSVTEKEKKIPNTVKLKTTDIEQFYDSKKWFEGVQLCLSCGACTAVCPTCYCFELKDELLISDPKKGRKTREWSSCQLESFTRVANDFIFRKERAERFKHRIYHQMVYFKKEYSEILCTGCGRCIRACPTRIDWTKLVNNMIAGDSFNEK